MEGRRTGARGFKSFWSLSHSLIKKGTTATPQFLLPHNYASHNDATSHVNRVPLDATSHVNRVPLDATSHINRVPLDATRRVNRVPLDATSHINRVPPDGTSHVIRVRPDGTSHRHTSAARCLQAPSNRATQDACSRRDAQFRNGRKNRSTLNNRLFLKENTPLFTPKIQHRQPISLSTSSDQTRGDGRVEC